MYIKVVVIQHMLAAAYYTAQSIIALFGVINVIMSGYQHHRS